MTSEKKTYRKDDTKPSDMFVNALSGFGIGSSDLTCGWCNRLHLCPDASCYQDEEDGSWKEYCYEEYTKNPDGVVLHPDYDAVSGQEINSIMFVLDCPCNGLHRYENFIWEHRDTIRNYLKVRIEQEAEWAEQELTKNKLAGISK
jgi:hypothetical protein